MPPRSARQVHAVATGIEAVDRELARRRPFPSAEAEEITAARLMARWRTLTTPSSSDVYGMLEPKQRRK
jgi:hypothetical protein